MTMMEAGIKRGDKIQHRTISNPIDAGNPAHTNRRQHRKTGTYSATTLTEHHDDRSQ